MTVEGKVTVNQQLLVGFLNRISYLDLEKAEPVGKDQIKLTWRSKNVAPTTIKIVAS